MRVYQEDLIARPRFLYEGITHLAAAERLSLSLDLNLDLLTSASKADRSARLIIKIVGGALPKFYFKISLVMGLMILYDAGRVSALAVQAAQIAVVIAAFAILQGFFQIYPFLGMLRAMKNEQETLDKFGRNRRRFLFVLIYGSLVFYLLNAVRFVGLFACRSHVFNFSILGCLPDASC